MNRVSAFNGRAHRAPTIIPFIITLSHYHILPFHCLLAHCLLFICLSLSYYHITISSHQKKGRHARREPPAYLKEEELTAAPLSINELK
jgi:hypothetical protein